MLFGDKPCSRTVYCREIGVVLEKASGCFVNIFFSCICLVLSHEYMNEYDSLHSHLSLRFKKNNNNEQKQALIYHLPVPFVHLKEKSECSPWAHKFAHLGSLGRCCLWL